MTAGDRRKIATVVGRGDRRVRRVWKPAVAEATTGHKPKRLVLKIRDHDSLAGQDMRFLWLTGWDLSRRDLQFANLRGARLSGADLSDANLHGAVLEAADLTGACLRGAILEDTNLRDALVVGADFRKTKGLTKTTLRILHDRGARV